HGSVAARFSGTGGYTDPIGPPSASLLQEIEFVDGAIGKMVSELESRNLLESTVIVISAKHGQSPIDPARLERISGDLATGKSPATIIDSLLPASDAPSAYQSGSTEDSVSLLWLAGCGQHSSST